MTTDSIPHDDLDFTTLHKFLMLAKDHRLSTQIWVHPAMQEMISQLPQLTASGRLVEQIYNMPVMVDPFMPNNVIQLRDATGIIAIFVIGEAVRDE